MLNILFEDCYDDDLIQLCLYRIRVRSITIGKPYIYKKNGDSKIAQKNIINETISLYFNNRDIII